MGPVGWQGGRQKGKKGNPTRERVGGGRWSVYVDSGALLPSPSLSETSTIPHISSQHTHPTSEHFSLKDTTCSLRPRGINTPGPGPPPTPPTPPRDRGAPAPPTGAKRKWLLSWAGGGGSQQLLAARVALAPGSSEKGQRQVSSRELPTCSSPFWQSPGTPFTHSVLHPLSKAGTAGQARGPKTSIALLGFD